MQLRVAAGFARKRSINDLGGGTGARMRDGMFKGRQFAADITPLGRASVPDVPEQLLQFRHAAD
jgi:hypothetical protein